MIVVSFQIFKIHILHPKKIKNQIKILYFNKCKTYLVAYTFVASLFSSCFDNSLQAKFFKSFIYLACKFLYDSKY